MLWACPQAVKLVFPSKERAWQVWGRTLTQATTVGPHAFYLDPPQESPAPGWPQGVPAVGWHLATGRGRGWAETLWGLHLGKVPGVWPAEFLGSCVPNKGRRF